MNKILELIFISIVSLASGITQAAQISYTSAQITALRQSGTFTNFTTADLIAGNNIDVATGVGTSTLNGNGFSFPNDMTRRAAASTNNNRWIQTGASEIWDLGMGYSSIVVGNDFDHDRNSANQAIQYLEALEYTAWGSNNQNDAFTGVVGGLWELGTLSAVYDDGWDAVNAFDDFLGQISFTQEYRYIHIIAANSISIDGFTSGDNEIDFVGGVNTTVVPVPAAVWLFGSGLLGLLGMRKKQQMAE